MRIINIKNLDYAYKKEKVLKDFSFYVEENEIISVIGTKLSGKTVLYKYIQTLKHKDITCIDKDSVIVMDIKDEYAKYFKINEYKDDLYSTIISYLIRPSKLIVLDDVLTYLSNEQKELIIKYLRKNKISLVNITTDIEETLFGTRIIVLDNGEIVMEGSVLSVLNEEKILRRLGFSLPFVFDLSKQLNYYGLLDEIILDREKLVDKLWK
jgi:energy-coupling factor transporter ATP-binding protein EcfA2